MTKSGYDRLLWVLKSIKLRRPLSSSMSNEIYNDMSKNAPPLIASKLCMQSALFYQFCPSVCLPNAGTVSKRMDLSSQFCDGLAGHFILVFGPHCRYKNSKGTPQRGRQINGVGKFCNCHHLYRKRYETGL